MRRLVLTTMVALLAMGPASGWAQTPSGDKMKDDKMGKPGGTMMEHKGDKMDKGKMMDKGMKDKDMGKMKDDKMDKK
ncbi:MAG TPA: hypothetical protein VFE48_20745 [Methylomirabilota bacterium]|nr:hypothetical protein [Methylomirabilota bacterium]